MLSTTRSAERIAEDVLRLLLPHRRGPRTDDTAVSFDTTAFDTTAFAPQLGQLGGFIRAGLPILFTLPGFPCKSPNPAKVLGVLPDEGERLSLRFLNALCAQVQQLHPPGARLLICSDGHVFGDLIDVPDDHIDAYAAEIRAIIHRERLGNLTTFDLRDVFGELSCAEKRRRVDELYAPTLADLRAQVRGDEHTLRLYRGVTRFLFEDSAGFEGSRSARQRSCRVRAYGVLRRSTAWGRLIAEHHPGSVRLSIHPQPAGSAKFGIRLLDTPDLWTTPWHSCVLRHRDGTAELLPRARAEQLGTVVRRDGRADHVAALG
ncbi:isocyanide synthase family protein [Amycolatopsis sp. NBC_00345]|uniref:isocyanide synthase family protein n=1 Tax=Amycolatopsis sp. NBC_00345 TaxID=2975955 RepID=UPI002E276D3D